jgi:hypothetical protein
VVKSKALSRRNRKAGCNYTTSNPDESGLLNSIIIDTSKYNNKKMLKEINEDTKPNSPTPSEGEAFYIGWMPNAPDRFAKHVKKVVWFLVLLVVTIAIVLALSQKKFDTGNFEFGTLTEVKGIYSKTPVPNLKIVSGKDMWGNYSYITAPLVGYGKHGADGIIRSLEEENRTSLDKKEITLKGTLLYNDGKLIIQIDAHNKPLVNIGRVSSPELLPHVKDLGMQKVKGEIIDPKCYFGVMKPGLAKPHRDCAIRCILGGVPPLLHVQNEQGTSNYYFIVGSNGEKMNEVVQDFVAEPVEMEGKLVQIDDWIVMYVNDENGIERYSYIREHYGNGIIACSENVINK